MNKKSVAEMCDMSSAPMTILFIGAEGSLDRCDVCSHKAQIAIKGEEDEVLFFCNDCKPPINDCLF